MGGLINNPKVIQTVGHSTRPIDEFAEIIIANGVRQIFDVRTVPRSRHNPQFNLDQLPLSLAELGIG